DFDEVEDFDEDAAVVEVDPEAEPVDDADKPLGLDNLDEVDDKVDTKKRNFLIAGVAAGLVVLVGGFIWPGFFTGGGDDVPPADDQAVVAEETEASDAGDSDMESDLSELYRVGDNITVLVGNKLTEVSIQEFLPAPDGGALAENEGGDLFVVTQSQLDRYAERNPDQFTDRAALIEDEGSRELGRGLVINIHEALFPYQAKQHPVYDKPATNGLVKNNGYQNLQQLSGTNRGQTTVQR